MIRLSLCIIVEASELVSEGGVLLWAMMGLSFILIILLLSELYFNLFPTMYPISLVLANMGWGQAEQHCTLRLNMAICLCSTTSFCTHAL